MEHGHWDMDYKEGNRCILRCESGYVQSGCQVQRNWVEDMPTCIKGIVDIRTKYRSFYY